MPHTTTFRFQAKPGERQAVIDLFNRWQRERAQQAAGFVRGVLSFGVSDSDQFMAGVMVDTTEHYNANSATDETNAWFRELRSHLVADPERFDGNVEVQMSARERHHQRSGYTSIGRRSCASTLFRLSL